ncbi:hypothetical protein RIF29_28170 [Crotalaria pallida]|uniref:Uncharacterized protein n=1 Tax=Crotalaria pallida TaxID=3830 RepID=A0AAN9I142_CROPI
MINRENNGTSPNAASVDKILSQFHQIPNFYGHVFTSLLLKCDAALLNSFFFFFFSLHSPSSLSFSVRVSTLLNPSFPAFRFHAQSRSLNKLVVNQLFCALWDQTILLVYHTW